MRAPSRYEYPRQALLPAQTAVVWTRPPQASHFARNSSYERVYFCSEACRDAFKATPTRYPLAAL